MARHELEHDFLAARSKGSTVSHCEDNAKSFNWSVVKELLEAQRASSNKMFKKNMTRFKILFDST